MEFGNYKYLIFLLFLLLIIWLSVSLHNWRKSTKAKFADKRLHDIIFPFSSSVRYKVKVLLSCLTVFLIIIALMDPLFGKQETIVKREGVDLIFALDLSNSMNVKDVMPSRLEKAKKIIEETLESLGGDRVGLIVFAAKAHPITPLTNDYSAVMNYVSSVSTDMLSEQGTDFSHPMAQAVQMFSKTQQTSKLLVILSDGEDNESGVGKAIKMAKEHGVHVLSIGVGTEKGGTIQYINDYGLIGTKKDENGNTVISRLQESSLRDLASASNGTYIRSGAVSQSVDDTLLFLSKLEKNEITNSKIEEMGHVFQWFLGLALILIFIETLTTEHKRINKKIR